MGVLNALKKANDWHADRVINGGRVIAHHSLSGNGPSTTHCAGCGKRAKKQVVISKKKTAAYCGSKACSAKITALMK